MQSIGYLLINDTIPIKVLFRRNEMGRSLKLRTGGTNGIFLEDESKYLKENESVLNKLLLGKVIKL